MTDVDKRDRIITAAYEVLSKQGYDRASTKEIAAAAGVAQGLINYYFPSKDQLFGEVFRREIDRYCNSFRQLIDFNIQEPLNVEIIQSLLEVPKKRPLEEPDWTRLRYELFGIGLRNEAARPILKEMLVTQRESFRETLVLLTGLPSEIIHPLSAILLSTVEGLALQRLADPTFEYDEAYQLLGQMLGAFYETLSQKREP